MVPEWFKRSPVYGSMRNAAFSLEHILLRAEYRLLTQPHRKEKLLFQTAALPCSNGSRFYTAMPFRVGMVADLFLLLNYACTCDLVYLTPSNWLEFLPGLDCVIVASVWHGPGGEWTGASLPESLAAEKLRALMAETRRRGVPVIFYSKEDPSNFRWFQHYAGLADQVYTSAGECVDDYHALFPGVPVETLHFAVSPHLHNPIGMQSLKDLGNSALFAGSWTTKYPKRVESQRNLFAWIRKAGLRLEIADRNYSKYRIQYRYPIRYLSSVLPDFTYEEISALYKLHRWILNLNSSTESLDMFSIRVYDALACGSLVLSNESIGMEQRFPQVYIIDNYERLLEVLRTPLSELEQRRLAGIRQAFRAGTVYERMERMLKSVGLQANCTRNPVVGVLLPGKDKTNSERLRSMFEAQTYPDKLWLGSETDRGLERCGMIALWGNGRSYGPYYLEDMVNGFKYTSCSYVTKPDPVPGMVGHQYTDQITDLCGTLFQRDCCPWPAVRLEKRTIRSLPNGYLSDGANYTVDGKPI